MLRLLGFLVVLAALVTGVGLWRGWVVVEAAESPHGSGITISLVKDKLRDDADTVGQKLRSLSQNVALEVKARGELDGDTTILRGTIDQITAGAFQVRLHDGEVIELATGTDVVVTLGGIKVDLPQLQSGDLVTVHLRPPSDDATGLSVREVIATR